MSEPLAARFAVRALGDGRFEGRCLEASPARAFGGHVLALALQSAQLTAPDDRPVHYAHARFLRPVDPGQPLALSVRPTSETRRFSRREVTGEQNGKTAVELSAAFALARDSGDFQQPMPDVPPPESLASDRTYPIEARQVEGNAVHEGRLRDPSRQRFWMRAAEPFPDDARLHASALGFMSDLQLLWVCLAANGIDVARRHEAATLEHTLWFHRPARADDWLLYDQTCMSTARGLGMTSGSIFTRTGALAASAVTIGTLP
jgi:acyl-CoA thioesterase-2